MAGQYTCGARINYVKGLAGQTQQSAEHHVGKEYPLACGACADKGRVGHIVLLVSKPVTVEIKSAGISADCRCEADFSRCYSVSSAEATASMARVSIAARLKFTRLPDKVRLTIV